MLTAETVDRIVRFDGHGLPVSSVYARVDADPSLREDLHARMTSLLDEVNPLAKNEAVEHEARLSIRADIDRIKGSLAQERWKPGAIAIFACSGRDLYEEVPLPRGVRDEVAVDATPHVRPMLTVLDEYHRTCVVVVDKASARVWEIYQDELREIAKVRGRALRKPNYSAGRVEERVRNKADELAKRHYRNVVQLLDQLFRAEDFDLLIIGGHEYEVRRSSSSCRRRCARYSRVPSPSTRQSRCSPRSARTLTPFCSAMSMPRSSSSSATSSRSWRPASLLSPAWIAACGQGRLPRWIRCSRSTALSSPAWCATSLAGWHVLATAARYAAIRPGQPRMSSTSWPTK